MLEVTDVRSFSVQVATQTGGSWCGGDIMDRWAGISTDDADRRRKQLARKHFSSGWLEEQQK